MSALMNVKDQKAKAPLLKWTHHVGAKTERKKLSLGRIHTAVVGSR